MLIILSQHLGNDPNLNKLVNGASKQLLCDRKMILITRKMTKFRPGFWLVNNGHAHKESRASLVAQLVKSLPAMQETWVRSLGWEDPWEKAQATHSSILAWRSPWTVQSMGSQRVGHNWATFTVHEETGEGKREGHYHWRSGSWNDSGIPSLVQTSLVSHVKRRMPRSWTNLHQPDGMKPQLLLWPTQHFSRKGSATCSDAESGRARVHQSSSSCFVQTGWGSFPDVRKAGYTSQRELFMSF